MNYAISQYVLIISNDKRIVKLHKLWLETNFSESDIKSTLHWKE